VTCRTPDPASRAIGPDEGRAASGPRVLSPRAGVGFKSAHARTVVEDRPAVGWFEVHAENYMGAGGPPHRALEAVRRDYPLSVHGVGLSIGGAGALDQVHLARLRAVCERYRPAAVSEHLAWSSHGGAFLNDLLPLPYTEETLDLCADHIDQLQEALGRQVLLENPATYIAFEQSDMDEIAFLDALARRTGCGLLLDVNNVFVSATNHGFDATAYLDAFPVAHVGEVHLAGHARDRDDGGRLLLIDAHDRAVDDAVWALFAHLVRRVGPLPTLIEWDNSVPAWAELFAEAQTADRILAAEAASRHAVAV
jgi:uncharacterized protein (UPF0276 family)